MNKMIIYSSQYGTTEKYAKELGTKKTIPVYSNQEIPATLLQTDEIIYIGAIYMGKISGFEKFAKKYNSLESKLTVISVGMYNPKRESNYKDIEKSVKASLQKTNFLLEDIFYLQGKLEVKQLRFKDKILVNTLYKSSKKKSANELNENEMDIIEAYEANSELELSKLDSILEKI
ncbi:flavodoxin domain-containing protein [Listeria seeligeri]|uniref:flavodoxin domain-containing protein n=1 Tax=Listeria seeligeri TaxID=1640 RepID=UPI00162593C5|nr:flavodoxin domain-containing protein [Listeria seeligeri]MBC1472324.1 DNA-directed RNA polymerase I [Listeria seeligeri]